MDQVRNPSQEPSLQNASLLLAVLLPLIIFSKIVDCWRHLGMLSRIDAAMLLILLGVEPILLVRARRRGKPQRPDQLLIFAYAAVLLTTLVFASRF